MTTIQAMTTSSRNRESCLEAEARQPALMMPSSGGPAACALAANQSTRSLRQSILTLICVLAAPAAALFIQTGSPDLSGNDSYYHVRMAEMLPSVGFVKSFPWLHWTIFRDEFVSHHHGFHVVLAPLVWLSQLLTGSPIWGGKAVSVVGALLTAWLMNLILKQRSAPHPWIWLLLILILPWHFWLRQSFARAPVIALPLLLGATLFMLKRRPLGMAVLGFIFTHVYGGVVLFPLVPAAFVAAAFLARTDLKRPVWCALSACIGLAAGLVINPYFPGNIAFLKTQIFETGLGAPAEVGGEWKSFDAWFLFQMSAPLALVWAGALVKRLRSGARIDAPGLAMLILNLGFLVLTIKARRFVEYWPVFALLDAAFLATINSAAKHAGGAGEIDDRMRRWMDLPGLRLATGVVAGVAILMTGAFNVGITRFHARPGHDDAALAGAMANLKTNSPQGSLVLTDDWDIFPACFYHNTHNRYAVGLDPVFTSAKYPEIWERYRIITRGEAPDKVWTEPRTGPRLARLDDIRTEFGAEYVLVARDHGKLYHQLMGAQERFERIWPPIATTNPQNGRQPAYAVYRALPPAHGDQSAALGFVQ